MNEFSIDSPHALEVEMFTDYPQTADSDNTKHNSQRIPVGEYLVDAPMPFELNETQEIPEQDEDEEDEISFYKQLNDIKSDQSAIGTYPNIQESSQTNSKSIEFPQNVEQCGSSFRNVDIGIQGHHDTDRFPIDETHSFYTEPTDHNNIPNNARYGASDVDNQLSTESWGDIFVNDPGDDDSCPRVSGNQINSNFIDLMRCEPRIPTGDSYKDESDIASVIENLDQSYQTRSVFQDNGTAGRSRTVINRHYHENVGQQNYSQNFQNHQNIYSDRNHPNMATNYSLAADLEQRSTCSNSSSNIPTVEEGACQEFHHFNFPTRSTDFHQFSQQYNELDALSLTPENLDDTFHCRSKNGINSNGLVKTLDGPDMEDEDDDVIIVSETPASNNLEQKIHSMRYEKNYMSSYVYPGMPRLKDYVESIRIELLSHDLWNSFHAIGTEMIITKAGRRMFPTLKINISGLYPERKYIMAIDILPIDNKRYRYAYTSSQWIAAGNVASEVPKRTYVHPESPANGDTWMRQTVVFDKMKLTNNEGNMKGHIILHSMHKYQPRIHLVECEGNGHRECEAIILTQCVDDSKDNVITFIFPETQFTTVTAYQNQQITKLKIDKNPFAKGFRDTNRNNRTQGSRDKPCIHDNPHMSAIGFDIASNHRSSDMCQSARDAHGFHFQ